MKITSIKGFADIFPGEVEVWQSVEATARRVFNSYNFSEVRIPILEKTELFSRSIGETTDIVEKEMYTFEDRDSRGGDTMETTKLTLRPEGTAGVVRAYVESEMYKIEPVRKLYYMGPMFRRERPQKGRMRQFHQIGAEALGRGDPYIDAEILLLLSDFFTAVGLTEPSLQINSLGCSECRPKYRELLLAFLKGRENLLCENCRRRIDRNPLRALDCKEPGCIEATKDAPSILDSLCAACREHFETVQRLLRQTGVGFTLNPRMVRGLDYYCRTTFEWTTERLGSQSAVAAGGRYDGLVQELGGPAIPGVGFAMGVERLTMLLRLQEGAMAKGPELFVVWVGEKARDWAFPVVHRLRQKGIAVEMEGEPRSLKSQMRRADKFKAVSVLIVGDDELANGRAVLRDMATKQQEEIGLDRIETELMARKAS
ncbi:MAG TPA: histidine--tRNA ligase [Candidatus Binatia bacterium]|jgi:histidyl-tRNA synthetase|nr:histidine--tRNA ligase [Candidatus Binatia bacterium]